MNKAIDGLMTVSASKIKVFRKCSRQYYYKYMLARNDRPEDSKNVASLMGLALHKAIENKYRNNASPTGTFQTVMDTTLDEWENAGFDIKGMDYLSRSKKVGKDILNAFRWEQFNPTELEYAFTLPFPNKENPLVNMTGYIDLIDINGLVVDHKSTATAPNQDELDNDPQFFIYYWAYQQLHGEAPWKVVWNHLRTDRLYEAHIKEDYDFKLGQMIEDIQDLVNSGPHYARKEMDSFCRSVCSFRVNCYGNKSIMEG